MFVAQSPIRSRLRETACSRWRNPDSLRVAPYPFFQLDADGVFHPVDLVVPAAD
jgi:hypothetical protein